MALAKRTGPDFLFLSNNHSQKFKDIEANPEVNVSFQDTKTQDWISVSGTATTSNSDPRIKEIWSRGAAAWFGDLGDGVHDGSATDPRMSLIEVKSKCMLFPFLLLHSRMRILMWYRYLILLNHSRRCWLPQGSRCRQHHWWSRKHWKAETDEGG
jgi:hypothetical protein